MTEAELRHIACRLREAAANDTEDPVLVIRLEAGAWAAERVAESKSPGDEPPTG